MKFRRYKGAGRLRGLLVALATVAIAAAATLLFASGGLGWLSRTVSSVNVGSAGPQTPAAQDTSAVQDASGAGGEAAQTPAGPAPSESAAAPSPEPETVEYTGRIQNIFFHPLIIYPQLAFDGDYMSDGLDDYMLTVGEYRLILQSLYDRGYVLVDLSTLYSETANSGGADVMVRNKLFLPDGKKPIVITFDDVNYYDYMRSNGLGWQLALDDGGNIAARAFDPDGNEVISRDLDAISLLDEFVEEHPDFSLNGAKGTICLTGYEGILGYRTQSGSPDRASEIKAVGPVVRRLKATGWTFASHSYSHLNMSGAPYERIAEDTQKWLDEVGSLVGVTDILVYPYGGRVDENGGRAFQYLQSKGFRLFLSVGVEPYVNIHTESPAVCMDRMHPDGITLRNQRSLYLELYDAKDILDLEERPDRPYDFSK